MQMHFSRATEADAEELARMKLAVAADQTARHGQGMWSSSASARALARDLARERFVWVVVAREAQPGCGAQGPQRPGEHKRDARRSRAGARANIAQGILGSLQLQTKKPWAIDVSYFTPVAKALYLVGMDVHPRAQGQGVGRALLQQAAAAARAWPADAIRLDAWPPPTGAGPFYAKCGYREAGHAVYRGGPLIYYELLL